MELSYDTDLQLASCRNRKTGKVVLVPSDNIESMVPKEQKAKADEPTSGSSTSSEAAKPEVKRGRTR
jgi:hypothetical protein